MPLTTTPSNAIAFSTLSALGLPGAEISAFDPGSKRMYVTSNVGLSVVDYSNPAAPTLIKTINMTTRGLTSTDVSSVAVKNGIVAAAVIATDKTQPGSVILLNAATDATLGVVTVGANPDNVTFTPDGRRILVANEAELDAAGNDPVGSVSIIDISGGAAAATVQTAGFDSFNGQEAALRAAGVRIFAGKTVAQDVEPETIAVSPDGATAMVTLQENNAVALLDIANARITGIVPLGLKDFAPLLADFSDRDSASNGTAIELKTGSPVFGAYMPDAIASFRANGQTYYVMANEGDDRDDFLNPDETSRVNATAYDLDNTRFPTEGTPGTGSVAGTGLKGNDLLGRLTVSNAPGLRGDTDGDGDIDQIISYGGRSFSIVDANGVRVFDSADIIERYVAGLGAPAFDDTRSDNKGPEPEGISVGTISGRTYAFVGLERSNMVMAFDVSNPADVTFAAQAARTGDTGPEGLLNISAADSPTGKPLLVVSNEVSNTLTTYQVTSTNYQLQLLHFSDGEAGLLASRTAPLMAALVDAFDDDYANTLILSGGDNYIPGPFLSASTDSSVGAVTGLGTNPGNADMRLLNVIGVEASTVGNHEFDLGTNVFADNLTDANFVYLTSNLDFTADSALRTRYTETVGVGGLETAASLAKRLAPSAVIEKGGERIGLVGATTQILERISSTGGVEVKGFAGDGSEVDNMALLASQLQPVINDLIGQGVNKIIVMSHLQNLANERALAPLLTGVDIILAAGSHTRLGDATDTPVAFTGHEANFVDTYPLVTAGSDGKATLIVNTDSEYTYLGRLVVEFDSAGNIDLPSLDAAINGAYASTTANVAAAWGDLDGDLSNSAFAEGTKGETVGDTTEAVQAVISAKDGQFFGFTNVYLEGDRSFTRTEETNLGNLSADANILAASKALGAAQPFLVSLKNGGGIRAQIGAVENTGGGAAKRPPVANPDANKPAGAISQLDIENALRFDNKLMVFDTTPQGLFNIFNFASGLSSGPTAQSGGYAQVGGIRFSYDPDNTAAKKLVSLSLVDADGKVLTKVVENGEVLSTAPATISVVSLSFTANGGDGYPIKANASNFRYLLTDGTLSAPVNPTLDFTAAANTPANTLGEQKAFQDFLLAKHPTAATAYDAADTVAAQDIRIENLNRRADDAVFKTDAKTGTSGADMLKGTVFADNLQGLAGDDSLVADGPLSLDFDAVLVRMLYLTVLDRAPDEAGWLHNTAAVKRLGYDAVASAFAGSAEFTARFGVLDNAAYLKQIYNNALERDPDSLFLTLASEQLRSPTADRGAITVSLSVSTEHKVLADTEGNIGQAFRLYTTALGRAPDLNGFLDWTSRLDGGFTYKSAAAGFAQSQEFQTANAGLTNTQLVEKLYTQALGRAGEAAGIADWVGKLAAGLSRAELVAGFAESTEAMNVHKAGVITFMRNAIPSAKDSLEGGAGLDSMTGGFGADTFGFTQGQGGVDVIWDFEAWDTVNLKGFGYADVAAAQAKLSVNGPNVVFNDQGQTISFSNTTLAEVREAGWLLG